MMGAYNLLFSEEKSHKFKRLNLEFSFIFKQRSSPKEDQFGLKLTPTIQPSFCLTFLCLFVCHCHSMNTKIYKSL